MDNNMYINIIFQEEYKKLDKLCKDCFSSVDGVSEYIRQMESMQYSHQRLIQLWEDDYKMLKHVRRVRNQLAHEVGTLCSDICRQEDLDFIVGFYNKILNRMDPLTRIRILKESERKSRAQIQQYTTCAIMDVKQNPPVIKESEKSLLSKFLEKIKKLFSCH